MDVHAPFRIRPILTGGTLYHRNDNIRVLPNQHGSCGSFVTGPLPWPCTDMGLLPPHSKPSSIYADALLQCFNFRPCRNSH